MSQDDKDSCTPPVDCPRSREFELNDFDFYNWFNCLVQFDLETFKIEYIELIEIFQQIPFESNI